MTKEELESLLSPEKEGEEDDESVGSHSMEPESSNSVAMMEIASPEPVNKVLNVVDV